MSNKTVNVLIVVDVQNCFISGGSMDTEEGKNLNKLADNKRQIGEILNLMKENEHIYLTRDFHPVNHISLENKNEKRGIGWSQTGTFPNHCRNFNSICPNRTNNKNEQNENDSKYNAKGEKVNTFRFNGKDNNIVGTDLSYLYFEDKPGYINYQNALLQLLNDKDLQKFTIGLRNFSYNNTKPNLNNIKYNIPGFAFKDNGKDKRMYQLTKGEFCEYESYSAFNYHLNIHYPEDVNIDEHEKTEQFLKIDTLETKKEYSTGLWENIIRNVIDPNKDVQLTINITVCGLVGDICVMNTVHHGVNMWKNVYNNNNQYPNVTVNFIYSFPGTLFLNLVGPFKLLNAYHNEVEEIKQSNIVDFFNTGLNPVGKINIIDEINKDYNKVRNKNIDNDYKFRIGNDIYNYSDLVNTVGGSKSCNKCGKLYCNCNHVGGNYYEKYMKYKQKYLALKATSNKY